MFNVNKLKINPDKNKILINNRPKINNVFKNFFFMAKQYKIKKSSVIKLLGTYIREDLKMDTEIGHLTANLHNKIHNLKQIKTYTDFHTRLNFLNSFIIGKINYMLPLYLNTTKIQKDRLNKVIMTAARLAIGNYCFKKTSDYILSKCRWMNILR